MRKNIEKPKKTNKIMKPNIEKAKRHLKKIREIVSKIKSPLANMSEEEVIEKIRKDREKLWEERFAPRS